MKSKRLLKVEEVALTVGVSVTTINNWYRFKKENPENEYARMLPDFIQDQERGCRRWNPSDIWRIMEFKKNIPLGRNGILGSITQRYYKRKENK